MRIMVDDRSKDSRDLVPADLPEFLKQAARQSWPFTSDKIEGPVSYRVAFGQEPIQLGNVEFRILLYLASRPYHPFTRPQIAEAVTTDHDPVTAASIDAHVASLRDQLGVLHDYVQTVPYIGYRFKA